MRTHTHTDTLSHSPEGAGKGRQAGGKVKERGIVRRGGQRKTGKEGLKGGGGGVVGTAGRLMMRRVI